MNGGATVLIAANGTRVKLKAASEGIYGETTAIYQSRRTSIMNVSPSPAV